MECGSRSQCLLYLLTFILMTGGIVLFMYHRETADSGLANAYYIIGVISMTLSCLLLVIACAITLYTVSEAARRCSLGLNLHLMRCLAGLPRDQEHQRCLAAVHEGGGGGSSGGCAQVRPSEA